jgi:ABC-type branched-subunit amino acid transport system ATPase component
MSPNAEPNILAVRDLTVRFGALAAVNRVSFDARRWDRSPT